jgi:hypothetical protein
MEEVKDSISSGKSPNWLDNISLYVVEVLYIILAKSPRIKLFKRLLQNTVTLFRPLKCNEKIFVIHMN